ncbi:hypothetical protein KKG29_01505 [Patescibacteria group bacterium]|nr:hypothetical protein [Patescibacteria group bacterium]MBU3999839.1 hypothetical protein [Patescibacteria group bacterium]MBU4056673.1 hypothetical protein [Patescibacteria group bacterium]MBU4368140.1 hypothetical protein [Patescibacteria group bacterium]
MNKLNYLLIPTIIILLISNIFLYSNLSKQNSDIKKEQISQNKNLQNLQNLVTFNWKEYQNNEFGFSFKYPEYVNICNELTDSKKKEGIELYLGIRPFGSLDTCNSGDVPTLHIVAKKNINNYKTSEEAFYKEFPDIDRSFNASLGYLEINKADAYGGKIANKITDSHTTRSDAYIVIILRNNYVIEFNDTWYDEIFENRRLGDKPVFDNIISSFYFSS